MYIVIREKPKGFSFDATDVDNRFTPDGKTHMGSGILLSDPEEECAIYQYESYEYEIESEYRDQNQALDVVVSIFTLGTVRYDGNRYVRIIKKVSRWKENTCAPGQRYEEEFESYPIKTWVDDRGFMHEKRADDDEGWEYDSGGLVIFGKPTSWWKDHSDIADISVTLIDTHKGTQVKPIDYGGLTISPNAPNEGQQQPEQLSNPESQEGGFAEFETPGFKTSDGAYPRQADKDWVNGFGLLNSFSATGSELKKMFNFTSYEGKPLVDDDMYTITYTGFNNPANNPSTRVPGDVTVIKGTYGYLRYLVKRLSD